MRSEDVKAELSAARDGAIHEALWGGDGKATALCVEFMAAVATVAQHARKGGDVRALRGAIDDAARVIVAGIGNA